MSVVGNFLLATFALNLLSTKIVTVSGDSMNNTLMDQDRLIVSDFLYTPERGDIVAIYTDALKYAVDESGAMLVKRVIAVEGDTISFDFSTGSVYLNGSELKEDYIAQPTLTAVSLISGQDYIVPEGCVFVMGDNRNRSTDSRDSRLGMVDTDDIIGKAIFRFSPSDNVGLI